jgi:hypothetical protein|tara:strand:- start:68 stop:490 length:423 start_codon:yes stop_codon:yes gene_type:complete
MNPSGKEEIRNGWTLEKGGCMCHFEHIPLAMAEAIIEGKNGKPSVVETINWTLAEDESMVHHNKYFTRCFEEAIAKAVEIELYSKVVAEEVYCVRIARDDELEIFYNASGYFEDLKPIRATQDPPWKGKAVSDEELSNTD